MTNICYHDPELRAQNIVTNFGLISEHNYDGSHIDLRQ